MMRRKEGGGGGGNGAVGPGTRYVLKAVIFRPLASLPASLAARILPPALHEPFTRFLVQAGDRKRGGAFLAATMLRGAPMPERASTAPAGRPTRGPAATVVLIGGPARVGKSLAANQLGERLGYPVLNTDHLHGWYGALGGHAEVREFREGWMNQLAGDPGAGVIVEGALLIMEGRHDTRDARVCLDNFVRWCRDDHVVGFTVGCAAADRIERLRAVEGQLDSCWTAAHSRRNRWRIVRHVAYLSASLRDAAARHGVPYREISPGTFHEDLAAFVAEAEATVRGRAVREPVAPENGEAPSDRVAAADAPGEQREEREPKPRQQGAHTGVAHPN